MMGAFREENKSAFFLPERVARMDPMPWHGSSRSAGALFDLKKLLQNSLCTRASGASGRELRALRVLRGLTSYL